MSSSDSAARPQSNESGDSGARRTSSKREAKPSSARYPKTVSTASKRYCGMLADLL
jgi:hypothetical protein